MKRYLDPTQVKLSLLEKHWHCVWDYSTDYTSLPFGFELNNVPENVIGSNNLHCLTVYYYNDRYQGTYRPTSTLHVQNEDGNELSDKVLLHGNASNNGGGGILTTVFGSTTMLVAPDGYDGKFYVKSSHSGGFLAWYIWS